MHLCCVSVNTCYGGCLYVNVLCFLFLCVDAKESVIDGSSPFASAYDLENIIRTYQDRNCELTKALLLFGLMWI